MPSGLEAKVEQEVVEWAKKKGLLPFKLNLLGNTGWPDRLWIFVYPYVSFIEFKRPGEELRRNQPARIAELRSRGYPVGVFDNAQQAIDFLETTALSGSGGGDDAVASVRRAALQAWARENERRLHGVSHPSRKRVR